MANTASTAIFLSISYQFRESLRSASPAQNRGERICCLWSAGGLLSPRRQPTECAKCPPCEVGISISHSAGANSFVHSNTQLLIARVNPERLFGLRRY